MEARILRAAAVVTAVISYFTMATATWASSSRTANFIIEAPTPELAEKIGKAAERFRHDLAINWIGSAMPNWSRPCPIKAEVSPTLGAGGQTSFVFDHGEVFGWDMRIQGSEERVLDSVLPHEVTHTIFASYFRQPLPRWADEGACTTVEHVSERNKQQQLLINFLRTGHGIAFHDMFAMKEYPPDVLPLYSQGYSLARYLIDQGGRQKFLEFVGEGMKGDNWSADIKKHYGYENLADLQNQWLDWVKQGSPALEQRPGEVLAADRPGRATNPPVFRAQSDDRPSANRSGTMSLAAARDSAAPTGMKANSAVAKQDWTPTEGDSFIPSAPAASADNPGGNGHSSVYDRRPGRGSTSSAAPLSLASSTSPAPLIPAASVSLVEQPHREPERIARRDDSAVDSRDHQVLLEWTRRE